MREGCALVKPEASGLEGSLTFRLYGGSEGLW